MWLVGGEGHTLRRLANEELEQRLATVARDDGTAGPGDPLLGHGRRVERLPRRLPRSRFPVGVGFAIGRGRAASTGGGSGYLVRVCVQPLPRSFQDNLPWCHCLRL